MALTIRPGNQIQSPNVDANRTYANRDIGILSRLGALQPGENDVLARVDGVIDNSPVDGKVDIDEMVRMEEPAYQAALFADEQQILPGLWRHMEWEAVPAAQPAPALPRLEDSVRERVNGPANLDYAQAFDINLLSAPLQRSARRIQLVLDGDANAQTVAIPDVDNAIAAPGRFTAGDLHDFAKIKAELEALVRQAPAQLDAQLDVPVPGQTTTALPHPGRTQLRIVSDVAIQEMRSFQDGQYSNGARGSLAATRQNRLEIEVPAGMQAVLIDTQSGREHLFEAGINAPKLNEGTYRVELWNNGQRQESSEVEIPHVADERVDLTKYLGFDLFAGGQALNRNLTFAEANRQRYGNGAVTNTARWSWEAQAQPAPANASGHAVAAVAPAPIRLPQGRYHVTMNRHGDVDLEVFGNGVLRAHLAGQKTLLLPTNLNHGKSYENTSRDRNLKKRVIFDPAKNELTVADFTVRDTNYEKIVLTADHRVG